VLAHGSTPEIFSDADLIEKAGLRLPPLARALVAMTQHPGLAGVTRLSDLPTASPATGLRSTRPATDPPGRAP